MFLPIQLNLVNKRILVVGGGRVALHKLRSIVKFSTSITVVGKTILPELRQFPLSFHERAFVKQDLDTQFLVYACTNDPELNREIKLAANAQGLLVNVADNPELCDFISPAIFQTGEVVVAVGSQGKNVRAAVAWRNRIRGWMENDPVGKN